MGERLGEGARAAASYLAKDGAVVQGQRIAVLGADVREGLLRAQLGAPGLVHDLGGLGVHQVALWKLAETAASSSSTSPASLALCAANSPALLPYTTVIIDV